MAFSVCGLRRLPDFFRAGIAGIASARIALTFYEEDETFRP
jgi:hypothetical protein